MNNTPEKTSIVLKQYLNEYHTYTPSELIKIANDMKDDGILSIGFSTIEDYGPSHVKFKYTRLETQEEADKRIQKEKDRVVKNYAFNEQQLKGLAAKLNYNIEKLP